MAYQFALNINDDNQGLSPEDGLPFSDLGNLISKLSPAISVKDGHKCTLYKVENHGYTPYFITESKNTYENFIQVHKNIFEKGIIDLSGNEAVYAKALKKILKENQYIEALDNNSQSIQRIYPSQIEKSVDSYYVIKEQSGIISEIGATKLDHTSHIYLDGIEYKIFISPQQDEQLRAYYKGSYLSLKIKQKRSVNTGRIISARLISHTIKSDITLHESLGGLTGEDLSFLNGINTPEDLLRFIRL